MAMRTWKPPQLIFLVWMLAAVLGQVYNLEHGDHGIREKRMVGLQSLFINAESSVTALKQNLDDIKKTVAEALTQCEHHDVSDSFLSFREQLIALLDKFGLEITNKGQPTKEPIVLRDCADVFDQQSQITGVYTIQPLGTEPFQVYCDMTTDGGGWTVFQKRGDFPGISEKNFYRGWEEYKEGFGDLKTEFWIGLSKISLMTRPEIGYQELRVDLADLEENKRYAEYKNFTVEDEKQDFRLKIGTYSGDAGDSLINQNLQKFSSFDRDNDENEVENCAMKYSGAWWYRACHFCNLNGLNLKGAHDSRSAGIIWRYWKGEYYSLSQTEMKFRPMGWTPKKNKRNL